MNAPLLCDCCSNPETETAIDEATMLCLHCQPCGFCGRSGTACNSAYWSSGCDSVEYPDRPRRDYNEVMAEIAAVRRRRLT